MNKERRKERRKGLNKLEELLVDQIEVTLKINASRVYSLRMLKKFDIAKNKAQEMDAVQRLMVNDIDNENSRWCDMATDEYKYLFIAAGVEEDRWEMFQEMVTDSQRDLMYLRKMAQRFKDFKDWNPEDNDDEVV